MNPLNLFDLCPHCLQRPPRPPLAICWDCLADEPDLAGEFRPAPLPDQPTAAYPGSRDKVAVLEERFARGCSLWHPGDQVIEDDSFVPLLLRVLSESYFKKRFRPRRQPRVHTCGLARHHQEHAA